MAQEQTAARRRGLMKRFVRVVSVLAAAFVLAACELPREGPGRALIENTAYSTGNTAGFVLVDVTRDVADHLRVNPEPGFGDRFGRGRPSRADRIGVGDVLLVRIWEADPAGLFSSTGLVDRGEIPTVVVDSGGNISIPYAGDLQAAGRTPGEISKAIVERLQQKTVEPQAYVTRVENVAQVVTVTGEVGRAGVYPLTMRGDTLLDTIAVAGGTAAPGYETLVSLTRNGRTATSYLEHVLNSPQDNIYLRPRDEIHLERRPKTFTAFGAVERKGTIEFSAANLSVLEAVGKVSGLVDARSDPQGVFLMRFEAATTAYSLVGQDNPGDPRQVVPTVYRFDLLDPNQYFFAQVVGLRDKDVIYVANAQSVEMNKVLAMLRGAVGTASLATSFGQTAVTLGQ
jgi:polysaccharide export outer membrane protein